MEWSELEASETYQTSSDEDRNKIRSGWEKDFGANYPDTPKIIPEQKIERPVQIDKNAPDFIPGIKRGVQNLQASLYGAGALAGKGLKALGAEETGQKIQDVGLEGYRRNVEEAKQYPKKYSFKDVYTGEAGVGGTLDWMQGTLGELVPSMAEAAIGAVAGSAIAPGIGTGAGVLAGRTILKKSIDEVVKKSIKKGTEKAVEDQILKQVTKQALKKLGGKVGMGAAVMPMETGGMYAELLEEHGIDAPETALLFGGLATALEYAGGNSKLVDTFIDALAKGSTGMAKKSAKEILVNTSQEALQEGGQEVLGILNTVVNTDEKFFTKENLETTLEAMAAGAVGGGAGGALDVTMSQRAAEKQFNLQEEQGKVTNQQIDNIFAKGEDQATAELENLQNKVKENSDLLNNSEELDKLARTSNINPDTLIEHLVNANENNNRLIEGIQKRFQEQQEIQTQEAENISPTEKAVLEARNNIAAQRYDAATDIDKSITDIDTQLKDLRQQAATEKDVNLKNSLYENVLKLIDDRNDLLDIQNKRNQTSHAPYTTREGRQELYEELWGTGTENINEKDAQESARIFQEKSNELDALEQQIEEEKNLQRKQELQKTYEGVFQSFEKIASDSAETFKNARMVDGVLRPFTDEQQDEVVKTPEEILEEARYNLYEPNVPETINQDVVETPEEILNAAYAKIAVEEEAGRQAEADKILADAYDKINRQNNIDRQLKNGLFTNEQQLDNLKTLQDSPQFQVRENVNTVGNVSLADIEKAFPNQNVSKTEDDTISVKFKNGKGLTIKSIQYVGNDLIRMAIGTGQMSKKGDILGVTIGNEILLDSNFADNATLWHENKHVLDNLGMITKADNSLLNKEFNRLRKVGKLNFALSTHKDPKQAMVENRANMFAQIMVDREAYRNKPLGKVIQRIMDFFNQLLSFGQQTVSGLAREVESGKIYERDINNQAEQNYPMFEVREQQPEQKISDSEYTQMFKERNDLVRTIGQTLRIRGSEFKQMIDKGLGSISTRLKNIDPMLKAEIRNLDFRTSQSIVSALRTAQPLLEKTKQMSPEDKFAWDTARRSADTVKINKIAQKYEMLEDQEKLRNVLNKIRQDAIDVGYAVGFVEDYWPRIIKDSEGFLMATKGISQRAVFEDLIKKRADKLDMTVEDFEKEFPEVAADIVSNAILGNPSGIGGPGNIQSRVYETIPEELNKYYMDSDAALMQYIYSMTKKIEARRFFGKVPERVGKLKAEKKRKNIILKDYQERFMQVEKSNPDEAAKLDVRIEDVSSDLVRIEQELDKYKLQRDYTENIGSYINDLRASGRIQAEDEKVVRDILNARFNEHGTTGLINAYKNMAYIDVMGSPISALTQIGDLAWAMYVGKAWTPKGLSNTIKNFANAATGKAEITKEDLGIERIAQEFADGTTLGNAVSKVFKMVGLEKIDSIGKETLINNALDNYKTMVQTEDGRKNLKEQIKPIFGSQSDTVINDLLANNHTENVKLLLYHRLLDFQPVALSEMPEQYLKSGNGRIFYMLKTYTLKQFDVFRNEAWHKIKSGEKDQVIEGIGNMIKLVSLLTLANAGADELKDLMLGKETKFEDHVIENFLTMGGASKYVRMQTAREGLGSGLAGQILPPFRFINSISKDLVEGYGDYVAGDVQDFNNKRILESIPVVGKLYYWHLGRGTDYKKSSIEQEFNKVGKDVRLFKKQFDNAQDKRLFLQSNVDSFKQMKLYENFQSALNRNKAVINKLEKIPQTTNVRERLGQLNNQREVLFNNYFNAAESMGL